MSRIARNPVTVPAGVDVTVVPSDAGARGAAKVAGAVAENVAGAVTVKVKGTKGTLSLDVAPEVHVTAEDGVVRFAPRADSRLARSLAGTMRSLVNNMVTGVSAGFERKLELVGVGYRAQARGRQLNLQLGLSHPVNYQLPDGIEVRTATQTEIVVSGIDKQTVGQVAAKIRSFRPPEPYKGKGVRYADERVRRKEGKKK